VKRIDATIPDDLHEQWRVQLLNRALHGEYSGADAQLRSDVTYDERRANESRARLAENDRIKKEAADAYVALFGPLPGSGG
jgi:hypothetical protein